MFRLLFAAVTIALPLAANATTVTYDLSSGDAGYATSLTYTSGSNSATLTPYLYKVAPASLTSTSQFVSADSSGGAPYVVRQDGGISIATVGEQNIPSEINQIDTYGGTNEILKISLVGAQQINSVSFNYVNSTDTLRIYGNNNGSTALTYLGFGGTFYNSAGSTHTLGTGVSGDSATTTDPSGTLGDGDTFKVLFSKLPVYQNYFFTSNVDAGDGYRLFDLTVGSVPEAPSWAMMIVGFGAIGCSMRRRRRVAALA